MRLCGSRVVLHSSRAGRFQYSSRVNPHRNGERLCGSRQRLCSSRALLCGSLWFPAAFVWFPGAFVQVPGRCCVVPGALSFEGSRTTPPPLARSPSPCTVEVKRNRDWKRASLLTGRRSCCVCGQRVGSALGARWKCVGSGIIVGFEIINAIFVRFPQKSQLYFQNPRFNANVLA